MGYGFGSTSTSIGSVVATNLRATATSAATFQVRS